MRKSPIVNLPGVALACAAVLLLVPGTGSAQSERQASGNAAPVGAVRLDLAHAAQVLGDRLRTTGKERAALTGVVTKTDGAPASVQLLREFPDKVRLEKQDGAPEVVLFDGKRGAQNGADPDNESEDLLELLVYDWPDQFFVHHADGSGLYLVASRAQWLESGRPTGVFYNVYDALDKIQSGKTVRSRVARFYVNADSGLIERVQYQGSGGPVEVRFTDWQVANGQRFPAGVERLENGKSSLTVVFSSAAFGAAASDGVFTGN